MQISVCAAHVVREVTEEVMSKDCGYSLQQCGVYALALENIIDVLPLAVEFACEPCYRAFLSAEFLLDKFADVNHALCALKC